MKLLLPDERHGKSFAAFVTEFAKAGELSLHAKYAGALNDFTLYVNSLVQEILGELLQPNHVAQTTYWLSNGECIVGVSRLRHQLNDLLLQEGGHIGYDVAPSQRGQGIATLLLRETLQKAMERGLTRVMLTCDEDNFASRRVIEKNGGVLEGIGPARLSQKQVLKFWIEI